MDIKKIRAKALLTQVEFAKEIGVSPMTIQRWENGQVPSWRFQRKIIEFCNKNEINIKE